MPELVICKNGANRTIPFEGTPILDEVLQTAGIHTPHPCGGRGGCGKCAVTLTGAVSNPNAAELRAGVRLSCQAVLLGDAVAVLPDDHAAGQIETATNEELTAFCPMPGRYGAAVDIGTTTIALKVYDLSSGGCIGTAACLNPQTAVAADVMGRIDAAMKGKLEYLQKQVITAVEDLLQRAVPTPAEAEKIDTLVLTGNTTMLYLLTGRNPTSLSRAPFAADTLFDTETYLCGRRAYLPPCMNAFVGADITCAVLASGICKSSDTALLCDIGTNGEMALWKDNTLYVTSTAAGPAFEGAGISCGCGSVEGAIDRVWLEEGQLRTHTIGEKAAVGICGSGLIDAIAAGLLSGQIDETGSLEDDELFLAENVSLQPQDIRAVQLAKAAIAAGMETLLATSNTPLQEVQTLYIAGGFGSHLDLQSAAVIGLLPEDLIDRTVILGNAALSGAVQVLRNVREQEALRAIAADAVHVNLGGNPRFNEAYMEHMLFGEEL